MRFALCLLLLGCHHGATPAHSSGDPVGPAAETSAPPPPAPAAPPPPPAPVANKRLAPPQRWEEIGHRGEERVKMGSIVWRGGETFEVDVMGSMKEMLQEQITEAIKAKPDDPGGAIQGVIDNLNEMLGSSKVMEWVRT